MLTAKWMCVFLATVSSAGLVAAGEPRGPESDRYDYDGRSVNAVAAQGVERTPPAASDVDCFSEHVKSLPLVMTSQSNLRSAVAVAGVPRTKAATTVGRKDKVNHMDARKVRARQLKASPSLGKFLFPSAAPKGLSVLPQDSP